MNQFKIMFMVLSLCLPLVYASAQPVEGGAGAPPAAPAPAPAPVPAGDGVAVPPVRGILGMEAGDYSFVQYDRGRLQSQYLNILEERSRADRDYFLQAVERVEAAFVEFVTTAVYGESGLKKLSDRAKGGGEFYPATEFLEATNDFQVGMLGLRTRIRTLTALADGALPSQIQATADGSGLDTVHNYGNIDFTQIETFYNDRLAEITAFVSNLQHNVLLANGNEHIIPEGAGKGLILDAQSVLLSPAKLREMQEKIVLYRQWDAEAEDKVVAYTGTIRILLKRFMTEFGDNERFRPRNDGDLDARDDAFRQIQIAFWTRSYLRVAYGVPLCTIGIAYEKSWFKLDRFLVSNKALSTFHETPVCDQAELMQAVEAYRNALTVADARASKIMDGNTSLLTKVNSFMTFVIGRRPVAEVLDMIFQLMAADAYEETILITEPDALGQLMTRYQARYFATPEMEAQFRLLRRGYDPLPDETEPAEGEEGNPFGGTDVLAGGSVRAEFQAVLLEAQLKQAELELARQLQLQIANAVRANQFSEKVNQRKKRL